VVIAHMRATTKSKNVLTVCSNAAIIIVSLRRPNCGFRLKRGLAFGLRLVRAPEHSTLAYFAPTKRVREHYERTWTGEGWAWTR
jgi:hypothetical protein